MIGVNSHWSVPQHSKGQPFSEEYMMLAALSVALARPHFDRLVMVTDKAGEALFKDFPYDDIHVILDEPFVYEGAQHIWSAGKNRTFQFIADEYRESMCNFDLDVLLFKLPYVVGAELFAQSDEHFVCPPEQPWEEKPGPYILIGTYLKCGAENMPYLPGHVRFSLTRREQFPKNVGIVGGENYDFIGEWGEESLFTINHPLNRDRWKDIYHSCAACFTEQYFFGSKARHEGKHVSVMFPDAARDNESFMNQIGYAHLIGDGKRDELLLREVYRIMREKHGYLYDVVKSMRLPRMPIGERGGFYGYGSR